MIEEILIKSLKNKDLFLNQNNFLRIIIKNMFRHDMFPTFSIKPNYAFVFKKKENNDFESGLKRVKGFKNIKEIICDDEWQLGVPTVLPSMFPGSNMYEILPHVYLTDINGKRLLGRFTLKDGQLVDNKRLWWQNNEMLEKNFLFRDDNKKYGIETCFFITTRFGYTNRIMQFIVHFESYELKMGLI